MHVPQPAAIRSHTHHSSLELGGLSPLVSIAGGVAFGVGSVTDDVVLVLLVVELVVVKLEVVVVAVVDVEGH